MESWSELLRGVLDAPGVRYACLADPATGSVLAAHTHAGPDGATGSVPDDAAAVLGWGSVETGHGAGPSFEDAVITTGATYHLVRSLPRDGAAMLAYLRVDRVRGNLALARRALLALPTDAAPHHGGAVAVPEQAGAPEAEQTPAPPIPLPRREAPLTASTPPTAPPAPPPQPAPLAVPPDQPGGRWADDLRTMARILAGLRRLDRSPHEE